MIVAPDFPMLETSTRRTFFEVLPPELVRSYNKSSNLLILKNGSEVYFRSATDPDSLRGPNLAWVWLDEGQKVSGYTWQVLLGRLRGSSTPSILLTCTPAGHNWVYATFGKYDPDAPQRLVVKVKTRDNIHLPPEYIQSLEDTYVGDFALQELEGEFVAFSGLVYREFRADLHVVKPPRQEWSKIIAGVDFGYTNPTSIIVIGVDYDGRLLVLDECYERRLTEAEVIGPGQDAARSVARLRVPL